MRTWLLPEYIEDILPPEAWQVEQTRRRLLDMLHAHGYELVIPPLLEYLPSLLTGTGHEMEIKTFKVVDQLSGRLMGLRADITPQAARIDAHLLNRSGVVRLCYAGSVLHTLPNGLTQTREPLQVGAELFGHPGLESDIEVQRLMLKGLALLGIDTVHLDLGHVAVFRSLAQRAKLAPELEAELFRALQAKDQSDLAELVATLPKALREALLLLPQLYGGIEVLDEAEARLPDYPELKQAVADLRGIAQALEGEAVDLCFDLAELRGYHYHSGVVFAAYARDRAHAIAQGGRYDEVGKAFGRARPATGFSLDLRSLSGVLPMPAVRRILAPHEAEADLQAAIEAQRAAGHVVVVDLPGDGSGRGDLQYDAMLVRRDSRWEVLNKDDVAE